MRYSSDERQFNLDHDTTQDVDDQGDQGDTGDRGGRNPESLSLWRHMRTCMMAIENEVGSRMRKQHGLSLVQFELMEQLHRFPRGLRMGELSRLMKVSGASITSITDQLEREELALRQPSPTDRRVNSVKLTSLGNSTFIKAAAAHEAWIVELMATLPADDNDKLVGFLTHLGRPPLAPKTSVAHAAKSPGRGRTQNALTQHP